MEEWRRVFRDGFAKLMSDASLRTLLRGLLTFDERLVQGVITEPPPLSCVADWGPERACAIGYAGWLGDGLDTVSEVDEYFARMCCEVDRLLGEQAVSRHFIDFYDGTPMNNVRQYLVPELRREIERRLMQQGDVQPDYYLAAGGM